MQRKSTGPPAGSKPSRLESISGWIRRNKIVAIPLGVATAVAAVGGAINNGSDALRTLGILDDKGSAVTAANPAVTAANKVSACMKAHGLEQARSTEWRKAPKQIGDISNRTRVFQACDWPPPDGADPDGYTEIRVRFARGLRSTTEWPIGPFAFRITSNNCATFAVALSTSGGAFERGHPPPVIVHPNEIKTADGKPWHNGPGGSRLLFLQERDEADVLYNDHYSLDDITCER